uniref:Secreted protein n=1 Tax=Ascaris lumbricoides TaxID=6252 RepID=A0A0M3I7L6_ASCLU
MVGVLAFAASRCHHVVRTSGYRFCADMASHRPCVSNPRRFFFWRISRMCQRRLERNQQQAGLSEGENFTNERIFVFLSTLLISGYRQW